MRFEDAIAIAYENHTDYLHDQHFSTAPQAAACLICCEEHSTEDSRWIHPHECAVKMKDEEAFVCCEECAEVWREEFFDEIEDYEIRKAQEA